MRGLLVLLAMAGGCSPYPRKGFVILTPSTTIANSQIHGTVTSALFSDPSYSLSDAISDGASYWNVVGCQFIQRSEAPNAIGPELEIVEGGAGNIGDFDAWYNPADGKVHISEEYLTQPHQPETIANVIAHELGHAMGLGHLQLPKFGIMSIGGGGNRLSSDDIEAFRSL